MNTVLVKPRQLDFSIFCTDTIMEHAAKASVEERGAVFTRSEVVDFILDLAGYTSNHPLHRFRLLEPSFGDGDFLLPAVERLLTAYETHVKDRRSIADHLCDTVRAVEVHQESVKTTRRKLLALFRDHGVPIDQAHRLLDAWIIQGDFLLVDLPGSFTHAIGNPPYVRQEMIPDALLAEYRARYSTIYDRADLYVPFIERCLDGLEPGGVLGFICSDRWMKNKYGAPLREMVARSYHLSCYVDMVDTPAFHSDVIAYPAITMIKREQPGPTRIAHRPKIQRDTLAKLTRSLSGESLSKGNGVIEVDGIVKGQEPWILQSFDQLAVVRRLETDFPLLEDAGCKVGIGVATGADRVFIGPYEALNVEPDRKLPLVTTRDIAGGTVKWKGLGVINPFLDDGSLVDLADYPKLARHFSKHEDIVRKRNCASKNPKGWYRTIDRILPGLTLRPKLLIPDIKGSAHVVFEDGNYYPHHNLYHLTSDEWDLRALQAVLQSGIAKLFVSTYSTQMRGGYLRFQAQYLRRIRIPLWKDIPKSVRKALAEAAKSGDIEACNQVTFDLYRLSFEERAAIMCLGK